MENKTKLISGIIITLLLAGGYYVVDDDQAYHCIAKDLVMLCEKLSSGIGTRCYFEDSYKICREGWVKIELGQEIIPEEPEVPVEQIPKPSAGTKWLCSPENCIRIY